RRSAPRPSAGATAGAITAGTLSSMLPRTWTPRAAPSASSGRAGGAAFGNVEETGMAGLDGPQSTRRAAAANCATLRPWRLTRQGMAGDRRQSGLPAARGLAPLRWLALLAVAGALGACASLGFMTDPHPPVVFVHGNGD